MMCPGSLDPPWIRIRHVSPALTADHILLFMRRRRHECILKINNAYVPLSWPLSPARLPPGPEAPESHTSGRERTAVQRPRSQGASCLVSSVEMRGVASGATTLWCGVHLGLTTLWCGVGYVSQMSHPTPCAPIHLGSKPQASTPHHLGGQYTPSHLRVSAKCSADVTCVRSIAC